MGLEVANSIEELDQTWPTGVDPVNKGDDHLRLIKDVLKKQFPGVGGNGFAVPITALEADLNNTIGSTSPFQEQINTIISDLLMPIGTVVAFAASFATIPDGWFLCDGDNGTVDLVDNFIFGTATEGEIGNVGGLKDATLIAHTHSINHNHPSANTSSDGAHTHKVPTGNTSGNDDDIVDEGENANSTNVFTNSAGAHTHSLNLPNFVGNSGSSGSGAGTGSNIPPYLKLAYIQRII